MSKEIRLNQSEKIFIKFKLGMIPVSEIEYRRGGYSKTKRSVENAAQSLRRKGLVYKDIENILQISRLEITKRCPSFAAEVGLEKYNMLEFLQTIKRAHDVGKDIATLGVTPEQAKHYLNVANKVLTSDYQLRVPRSPISLQRILIATQSKELAEMQQRIQKQLASIDMSSIKNRNFSAGGRSNGFGFDYGREEDKFYAQVWLDIPGINSSQTTILSIKCDSLDKVFWHLSLFNIVPEKMVVKIWKKES